MNRGTQFLVLLLILTTNAVLAQSHSYNVADGCRYGKRDPRVTGAHVRLERSCPACVKEGELERQAANQEEKRRFETAVENERLKNVAETKEREASIKQSDAESIQKANNKIYFVQPSQKASTTNEIVLQDTKYYSSDATEKNRWNVVRNGSTDGRPARLCKITYDKKEVFSTTEYAGIYEILSQHYYKLWIATIPANGQSYCEFSNSNNSILIDFSGNVVKIPGIERFNYVEEKDNKLRINVLTGDCKPNAPGKLRKSTRTAYVYAVDEHLQVMGKTFRTFEAIEPCDCSD